jgi:hypothetical protein
MVYTGEGLIAVSTPRPEFAVAGGGILEVGLVKIGNAERPRSESGRGAIMSCDLR